MGECNEYASGGANLAKRSDNVSVTRRCALKPVGAVIPDRPADDFRADARFAPPEVLLQGVITRRRSSKDNHAESAQDLLSTDSPQYIAPHPEYFLPYEWRDRDSPSAKAVTRKAVHFGLSPVASPRVALGLPQAGTTNANDQASAHSKERLSSLTDHSRAASGIPDWPGDCRKNRGNDPWSPW